MRRRVPPHGGLRSLQVSFRNDMQRVTRALLALLLLNLSFVGQELACDHEPVADHKASAMHDGAAPHHAELPTEQPPAPCDDSAAQCCDAIASCSIIAIAGRGANDDDGPDVHLALVSGAYSHHGSAPIEVATPPPKA